MTVDYNKLVQMLLPSFVRQVRMVALLRVLIAPIGRLSVELLEWFEWRRIRMAATPQAKWMEYMVLREVGLTISIREGNHRPWDFIVGISIDETNIDKVDAKRKAESLINRYKQAGRRWIFDNDMLVPSARFDGFVCQSEGQTARFEGFVCQLDDQRPTCTIVPDFASGIGYVLARAYADCRVASDVIVYAKCTYDSYWAGAQEINEELLIRAGERSSDNGIGQNESEGSNIIITLTGLSISGDNVYKYVLGN